MRIGLFALSGIRACDPELLELGMTMPGTLERGRVIARLPSLGLLTLAGMVIFSQLFFPTGTGP